MAGPDTARVFNSLLSTLSSLFKSKSSRRRPIFRTSLEGIDGTELKDWGAPVFTSFPSFQIPPSELPARFELKPLGPGKVPWLEILDLQSTDEYAELVSNPWSDKRKCSNTFSPFVAEVPIMLIYKTVPDQVPLMMATDRAGIETPTQQQQMGEYSLTYSQELSLIMFGILFIVFIGVAVIRAIAGIKRKLRHHYIVHCCLALSFDRSGMCAHLYIISRIVPVILHL